MRIRLIAALCGLSLSFAQIACAASVTSLEGQVLRGEASGFNPLAVGQTVQTGDRVLVREGARARIVFDNGCVLVLDQPGVHTLPEAPVCGAGVLQPPNLIVGAAIAAGVGVAIYAATKPSSP